MKRITALIPCYNEAEGIGAVIDGFPVKELADRGFLLNVIVIDNNSSDLTAHVARSHGADVIYEANPGKGNAIRTGFFNIPNETDYVVMLDGDNTYLSSEIIRMIEPLDSGFADVIVGSRMGGKITEGSMDGLNRLGNWLFSFIVRVYYKVNVTDVLTGYFAWKKDAVISLRHHLKSEGFAIEMEMITKMGRLGLNIYSVPITYEARMGDSSLSPLRDGSRILKSFIQQMWWKPEMQRFAFVSDSVFPFNKGGKEKRLYEITRRLVRDGREVHIYTMKWWPGPKTIRQDGVYLHAISKLYPLYKNDKRSMTQAILYSLTCFKLLFVRFDVIDVDHIPFFPLFTVKIVCLLRRKKLYATWHEVWGTKYWKEYLGGMQSHLGAISEKISMKLPDIIVSNSEHTTARLKSCGVKKPVYTIPLGVDLENIYAMQADEHKSDIIYAGRLIDHKNVNLLIEAVSKIKKSKPDILCIIVGDGPEKNSLKKLVHDLGLEANITFYKFFEKHEDVFALMKASKMLVLPSIREGFGLVVLEANACGLPVITTDHKNNAAKDLIFVGENGLLAESTVDDLTKQISILLKPNTMNPIQTLQGKLSMYQWKNAAEALDNLITAS